MTLAGARCVPFASMLRGRPDRGQRAAPRYPWAHENGPGILREADQGVLDARAAAARAGAIYHKAEAEARSRHEADD
jgi:hypothetical protein